jgi:hypothetical protein
MSVTTTNLIMGPATLYVGAFGATEPADAAVNSTPAASAWTDIGGTDGGIKLTVDQKYTELTVDQIVDRVGSRLTSRNFMVETNLAEPTLENLAYALNGGTAASGSGYKSFEPIYAANSASQPTYVALLFDGFAPNGFRRRVIVRKALSTDKVETAYDKNKQTFFSVTFTGHYVSSSIAPVHAVDQTS